MGGARLLRVPSCCERVAAEARLTRLWAGAKGGEPGLAAAPTICFCKPLEARAHSIRAGKHHAVGNAQLVLRAGRRRAGRREVWGRTRWAQGPAQRTDRPPRLEPLPGPGRRSRQVQGRRSNTTQHVMPFPPSHPPSVEGPSVLKMRVGGAHSDTVQAAWSPQHTAAPLLPTPLFPAPLSWASPMHPHQPLAHHEAQRRGVRHGHLVQGRRKELGGARVHVRREVAVSRPSQAAVVQHKDVVRGQVPHHLWPREGRAGLECGAVRWAHLMRRAWPCEGRLRDLRLREPGLRPSQPSTHSPPH